MASTRYNRLKRSSATLALQSSNVKGLSKLIFEKDKMFVEIWISNQSLWKSHGNGFIYQLSQIRGFNRIQIHHVNCFWRYKILLVSTTKILERTSNSIWCCSHFWPTQLYHTQIRWRGSLKCKFRSCFK